MERFKRSLHRLLYPHPAIILLLLPFAIAGLIAAFALRSGPLIDYPAYVLSAYTLTVILVRAPRFREYWNKIKKNNAIVRRLVTDLRFRQKVTLAVSLSFNLIYALFQLGMGFYYRSRWFFALATYYVLLILMRWFLLRDLKNLTPGENMREELRRYRFCGWALAAMTPALIVIVIFIIFQNRGFSYHPITTIAIAAYTFTTFTLAIINVVRHRKHKSPLISAAKVVSMTTASVSMLSLETAMLFAFGNPANELFNRVITGTSGALVCIFVLTMAIHMIVRAKKELKEGALRDEPFTQAP